MADFIFKIRVRSWKDKQTRRWLLYSKKYEISAYGCTKVEAKEMFNLLVSEYLLKTKPKK